KLYRDLIHDGHQVAQKSNMISFPLYSLRVMVSFPSGWLTTCKGMFQSSSGIWSPIERGLMFLAITASRFSGDCGRAIPQLNIMKQKIKMRCLPGITSAKCPLVAGENILLDLSFTMYQRR